MKSDFLAMLGIKSSPKLSNIGIGDAQEAEMVDRNMYIGE